MASIISRRYVSMFSLVSKQLRFISNASIASNARQHESSADKANVKLSRQKQRNIFNSVISSVDVQISSKSHGRLFAIVQLDSKQFKITDGDIIVLEGAKSYDIGDKIRIEKVLCIGCENFTLFGRPLISRDIIDIEATVIEKTLDETQVQYHHVPRKAIHFFHLVRNPISLVRINRIELLGDISSMK